MVLWLKRHRVVAAATTPTAVTYYSSPSNNNNNTNNNIKRSVYPFKLFFQIQLAAHITLMAFIIIIIFPFFSLLQMNDADFKPNSLSNALVVITSYACGPAQ